MSLELSDLTEAELLKRGNQAREEMGQIMLELLSISKGASDPAPDFIKRKRAANRNIDEVSKELKRRTKELKRRQ